MKRMKNLSLNDKKMKAILISQFGKPDIMELKDVINTKKPFYSPF